MFEKLVEVNCSSPGLGGILFAIKNMLNLIQIIAPILLIVMASLHIFAVMRNPDDKKRVKKVINSFIAAAVIFFIPMLLNVVMQMLGTSTTISDCWNAASNVNTNPTYVDPYDTGKRHGLITDPGDYQKGSPKPSSSASFTGEKTPSQVDDSKYDQYKQIAKCDSETMKFRIIEANRQQLAIIWVADPVNQLNLGLAAANSKARLPAETIMNNEISSKGLQSKCLVAVNASFFSYSTNSPVSGVVIHNGTAVKNEGTSSGCVGVTGKGELKECSHKTADEILSMGIRNTFGISSPAGLSNSGATANRTQICQIDTNNFVLLSGSGTVGGAAQITKNVTGCGYSYNLDGGGSRKLYYKTQSSSLTKVFGGDRTVPDMLYFAEQ